MPEGKNNILPFPSAEKVGDNLQKLTTDAQNFLREHAPKSTEQHNAFVQLSNMIREVEEVRPHLLRMNAANVPKNELDSLVIGARKTYEALAEALKNAKRSVGE